MDKTKAIIALILTFAGGFVDIVGYLRLAGIFTAHMTGNTVHLAQMMRGVGWQDFLFTVSVLIAFVAGSVLGRVIIETGKRRKFRRVASFTLFLEAALLAFAILVSWRSVPADTRLELLIALALAMGLQTATLTRVGPLTIHTTFMTGTLNRLGQLFSHLLFLTFDIGVRGRPFHRERRRVARQTVYISAIWFLYFAGAAIGAPLALAAGLRCLLIPLAILGVAIASDQFDPLSLQEEKEEVGKP